MRTAEQLAKLFKASKLGLYDVDLNHDKECIVLTKADVSKNGYALTKTGKRSNRKPKPIEYDDIPAIKQMRSNLNTYNQQLEQTFIDIPSLEKSVTTRTVDGKEHEVKGNE